MHTASEIFGLGFLRRKFLAFCLCKIFELLFRHGLSHLFRRAFEAGFSCVLPVWLLALRQRPSAVFLILPAYSLIVAPAKKRMYSLDSKQTLLARAHNKYTLIQFNVEKELAKAFR